HGIHENHFAGLPLQRFFELLRNEAKVEALLIGMPGDASKSFGKSFSIAVSAAGSDLGATAYGIPGGVGPLYFRIVRHMIGLICTCSERKASSIFLRRRNEAVPETFFISTDPAQMDVDAVHAYLTRSYWAEGIPRELVAKSIEGSLCFGLFDGT